MHLDGEGAVIYGTQSYNGESPTSDDVFQHIKGCKEKGFSPLGGGSVCAWCPCL
jgi:hypothetical protein